MKNFRICFFALLTHLLLTSCSNEYVPSTGICNVSGHLHIAEGKVYITPFGYAVRDAIAEFEIKDGVFNGSFEGDPNMAYTFYATADGNSLYYCPFFAEKEVSFINDDKTNSPVSVAPRGHVNRRFAKIAQKSEAPFLGGIKETSKRLAEMEEDGSAYSDAAQSILAEMQSDETTEERRRELEDMASYLVSRNEIYSEEYMGLDERNFALSMQMNMSKLDYVKKNVNLASFLTLYSMLHRACDIYGNIEIYTNGSPERADMYRSEIITIQEIYAQKYAEKFVNHPFHDSIMNLSSRPSMRNGVKFTDFTLPDADGVMHSLSSLIDGKVAVVDLWASWCRPCRKTSVSMIPLWEKYHDKGFVIVGAAREYRDDNKWRKALDIDGCPWIQLIAMEKDHHIWDSYGVASGAGSTFLVDRNGVIIKVNPSIDEIEEVLLALW